MIIGTNNVFEVGCCILALQGNVWMLPRHGQPGGTYGVDFGLKVALGHHLLNQKQKVFL